MQSVVNLYHGREEAPMNDQLYEFTKQKKLADLLALNCALLEKKLLLCTAKTLQGKCDESTYLGVVITGAKDISTLPSSTPELYVKVKCGDAVFHTHPFEKMATDWASAPMEIKWSEVPPDRMLHLSIMDQTGEEVARKEVEVDLLVGHGFDRWITMQGSACLRLQVEHKGVPSLSASGDLETDIAELVSRRRHLKAVMESGLPPMSYATYTTMVAEVERRLYSEIIRLRDALQGRPVPTHVQESVRVVETNQNIPGVIRLYEDAIDGAVHVVEEPGAEEVMQVIVPDEKDDSPMIKSLIATLTGRNRVIRQLQDTLASIEGGHLKNASETILLLASQLEERETTLNQIKADLPPQSLSALVIDQSNVINTLLSQLHKALGSLGTANKCVERLTSQAALFGGDLLLQKAEEAEDPLLTQPQIASLLTRFDENVCRIKELEAIVADHQKMLTDQEDRNQYQLRDQEERNQYLLREREERYHDELQEKDEIYKELLEERDGMLKEQEHRIANLLVDVTELRASEGVVEIGLATAKVCEQFNDSLGKLAEICFFLAGDPAVANTIQNQLPKPIPIPEPGDSFITMARALHALREGLVDAHLLFYDETKNSLPRMERLRYLNEQDARDQRFRKLELKLRARTQDFNDLLADHEALLVALATARQQLAAPILVQESTAGLDKVISDACLHLLNMLPEADQLYFLGLPLRERLPALLNALGSNLNAASAVRVIPLELRGVTSQSPYIIGRLGNAVQQTPMTGPSGRWGTPMTFAVDGGARNLELNIHDRIRDHPLGRTNINIGQFPYGVDRWVPLDNGGELKVRLEKAPGAHRHTAAGPSQAQLDGIAQKLENTIDVMSRGAAHVLRPSHVTPAYLHKLADLLWELAHGGASPLHAARHQFGPGSPGGRRDSRSSQPGGRLAIAERPSRSEPPPLSPGHGAGAGGAGAGTGMGGGAGGGMGGIGQPIFVDHVDPLSGTGTATSFAPILTDIGPTIERQSTGIQADYEPEPPIVIDGYAPGGPTLQFLMRSRAGLIRRIWACLQICKVCNHLSSKHHSVFSHKKGHKMDVGEFKSAIEDLCKLLSEVGSLEDGLSWIVANYFTDTEKRDLGTSPHLYPASEGVRALPGLIESTDMIEARRLSPSKRRPRPPSPSSPYDRRDFLRRLEDAHITVLDSKDGAMDGKYFGYDLRAVQHLDGDVHGISRRKMY